MITLKVYNIKLNWKLYFWATGSFLLDYAYRFLLQAWKWFNVYSYGYGFPAKKKKEEEKKYTYLLSIQHITSLEIFDL